MKYNILLVDDDPGAIQLMGRILSEIGDLRFATNGRDALRLARESVPDVILLDAEMPGMTGFEVCEAIKADPAVADAVVIFVTSHRDPGFELSGFELGAADFIVKPVSPPLMLARVKTQLRAKRIADELRQASATDALTGLANRRRFDERLPHEWKRARRRCDPIALLSIDVDHFKLFNDRYGHPAGDECLRAVAKALKRAALRPADLVARCGGEEFGLLLPMTAREGAAEVAHRVLAAVESLAIAHEGSPSSRCVTVSVGVACYDDQSACWIGSAIDSDFDRRLAKPLTALDLVKTADSALYAAKNSGRARARLLDVADASMPDMAVDISTPWQQSRFSAAA